MKLSMLLVASLLTSSVLYAAKPLKVETISLEQAQNAVNACVQLAKKNKWAMSITVIDIGVNEKATARMDGALPPASIGSSLKAKTSLSWWMPSEKVATIVKKEPNFKLFPGLLPIGGGVPIFAKSGAIIGAVGVAGSAVKNDMACALVAAKAASN